MRPDPQTSVEAAHLAHDIGGGISVESYRHESNPAARETPSHGCDPMDQPGTRPLAENKSELVGTAKDEREILDSLSPEDRQVLDPAAESPTWRADQVMNQLNDIMGRVNATDPGADLLFVGTETRVKGIGPLARKSVEAQLSGDARDSTFLSQVNDAVRFSIRVPDRAGTGTASTQLSIDSGWKM